MTPILALAMELVRRPSVTPEDAGCQGIMAERLEGLGFRNEWLRFGEVTNLWARRGQTSPVLAFAGHTDVVPTGPLEAWSTDPFEPTLCDGNLHGRGAADMKGSLAAMIVACERFVARRPNHVGSIAFLVTSDEEGPAHDGTRWVVETLSARGEGIDWCIVGEPTSDTEVGDVVKNGRRGSLNARLHVKGHQGHVAYPEQVVNPIHRLAPALAALTAETWDNGNAFFPPTSLQVSNINAGTGAVNVVPGHLESLFNLRYSTEVTAEVLRERIQRLLTRHGLDFSIDWQHSGEPFLTEPGILMRAVEEAVVAVTDRAPRFSTTGGTSDGRFIAPTGAQVIELGPVNATIHKVDEHVRVADLDRLGEMYEGILDRLLPAA
jgi:succinyl-diaminopimelate desuccinylase